MNANTLKQMQHFKGKVCTIITTSMNRSFTEAINREHFSVRVQEITMDGIWCTHPYNDEAVSFFALPHIISIHEEWELDPNNPEHAAMIAEYERKTGQKIQSDIAPPPAPQAKKKDEKKGELLPVLEESPAFEVEETPDAGDATFVDIASLERLAEQTRRTFEAYEMLGK